MPQAYRICSRRNESITGRDYEQTVPAKQTSAMNTKTHDSKRPLALALAPYLLLISSAPALAESSDDPAADPAAPASTEPAPDRSVRVFPRVSLFAPLSADPRWPKFTVAYSYYFGDSQFTHVGSAEAGASIAIVQKDTRRSHSWEIGLQAGIFSIFDFGAPSTDLVNADYLGGLTFSYAFDSFVFFTRFFHQSSHLGDEFLLNNEVERINLSFEQLEVLLSYDPRPWARVYGGAAAIVRIEPSNIDRWLLQAGAEFRPLTSKSKVRVQLLTAVDLQLWQQSNWVPDASFIVGATLDPIGEASYRVDFLLRYYIGRSPNGQFFSERIHTLGPAAQLYF
jgi:hypothetical protein